MARSKANKTRQRKAGKMRKIGKSKKKGQRKSGPSLPAAVRSYARLLMDPCAGPLVRGLDPNNAAAVVQRVRTTVDVAGANGYAVWFPGYTSGIKLVTGVAPDSSVYNAFLMQTASSADATVNNSGNPLGKGNINSTAGQGTFLPDPAAPGLQYAGAVYSRAKALAACMQVDYTGALSSTAGQIAVVRNITHSTLFKNSATPLTVDEVFAYAAVRERLQMDGHEVKWSPTDAQSKLRTYGPIADSTALTIDDVIPDAMYVSGLPATRRSWPAAPDYQDAVGIVIAWRNVPVGTLVINMVKVVEYELGAINNGIEEPRASDAVSGFSTSSVTAMLTDTFANWQLGKITPDLVKSGVGFAATGAFAAAANAYAPRWRQVANRSNMRSTSYGGVI